MKNIVKQLLSHKLISGSIIIFFGTLAGNFFNFLFNVAMSRSLIVSDYGLLTSTMSLIGLLSIPAQSLVPTVVHFAATFAAKKNNFGLASVYFKATVIALLVSGVICLLLLLFSSKVAEFMHITSPILIFMIGLSIIFGYLVVPNVSVMQAKLQFLLISIAYFIGAIAKYVGGLIFIGLGLHFSGALLAVLLSAFVYYIITIFPILSLYKSVTIKGGIKSKTLFTYGALSGFSTLGLTSLITSDVLLVNYLLNSHSAGLYGGLALIGKVIFFVTSPISSVMFPLITQKYAKQEPHGHELLLSFLLVLLPSLAITLFYFLFPEFTIYFFIKNNEYLIMKPYLAFFGLYIMIYALISLFTNYFLSIKKVMVVIPVLLGAIFQVIGISLFHNSYEQIITVSLTVGSLLLSILLLYYFVLSREYSLKKL